MDKLKKKNIIYNPLWRPIRLGKDHIMRRQANTGFGPIRLNSSQKIQKISLRNLTWPQASIRFPRLNPFGDADRDGIPNMFDCRPFNRRRHDDISFKDFKFDDAGKLSTPSNIEEDIRIKLIEPIERSEEDKAEMLKNIIFKRLRQKFKEEKRAGKIQEDENYWEWVHRRKEEREEKEAKRRSDEQRAAELGLLPEDY